MTFISCGGKFGKGGENAAQYVREQMPEMTKDAINIEAVGVDTVRVYDIKTLTKELEMKEIEADIKTIKFKELREFADSIEKLFESRLMYIVAITAKSTKKDEIRVIMENDCITPYMLYEEYEIMEHPFKERIIGDQVMVGESDIEEDL